MRRTIRWLVGSITVLHGAIHLLGAAKGLGLADVDELQEPISEAMGGVWLGTAILVITAGVLILRHRSGWWPVAAVAAVLSQSLVVTSWSDASAGTAPNLLLAVAAAYGYRSHGPSSARTRYATASRRARELAGTAIDRDRDVAVTEADLAQLPPPIARYVRASGALGRPHVAGFRATIHGRIRGDAHDPWMEFVGEQTNTVLPTWNRVFYIDATKAGLPVDVLHEFVDRPDGAHATMQAEIASTLTIVDSAGDDMDQSETVTLLNDLCLLAPAALVDAPVRWTALDDRRAIAELAHAGHVVGAELTVDHAGRLVDFVSDDRRRAVRNGAEFVPERWSTPIDEWGERDGRTLVTAGRGRWHPPTGAFDYVDFHVDDIEYLPTAGRAHATS
jgi:hypothetical protein